MNYSNDFIEPYGSLIFDGSTTLASAKNMNKLGNQYTSGVYLIDHHNHEDNYYTKTEMDLRYFSDTNKVGSDADMVDGDHLADLIGSALPKYSIIPWESATVPTGYALCNGQISNGVTTIDMRDYFVPTAGSSYTLGQTFGSNLFTISVTNLNIANHVITITEMPYHAHTYTDIYWYSSSTGGYQYTGSMSDNEDLSFNSSTVGSDSAHDHNTGSSITITGSQINGDNRPSFYALYFIEKVI